jgi:LysM repeat protein
MMNFVAPKTVGPKGPAPLVEQSIPTASNDKLPVGNYVIHKIIPNETLDRISIIYNVPKDAIRKANGFTGDEIYMKRELIIPNSCNYPIFLIKFRWSGL